MSGLPNVDESYLVEVMRKGIHLSSLSIPIIYYFISRPLALSILVPVTIVVVTLDAVRLYHEPTGRLYGRYLGFLLRRHEQNNQGRRLNGATWVLVAATISLAIFPKVIFLAAFAILIVSDSAAALIGRRFGRHRFFGKSLEGSMAFFLSAVLVILLSPKIQYLPLEYALGFAASFIGAFVEAAPIPLDDNFSIPFSIGGAMWLLYAMLLPAVDVFALR